MLPPPQEGSVPLNVVEEGVRSGAPQLAAQGLVSWQVGTGLGQQTLVNVSRVLTGNEPVSFGAERRARVALSTAFGRVLPHNAVLSLLTLAHGSFSAVEGNVAVGAAMDVSLCTPEGDCQSHRLREAIFIRLPDSNRTIPARAVCAFLDLAASVPRWSTRGVRRATEGEIVALGASFQDGVWCRSEHLSIFAVVWDILLGCTNLELLSEPTVAAVREHEDWTESEPAAIVLALSASLVALLLLGVLWEAYEHRLGSTRDHGKAVRLCANCVKLGPQLLKHRYAALLVYARDVLNCLRMERSLLRGATLTAATQRLLAVRNGLSVACVTQHCWKGAEWCETKPAMAYTILCCKLRFHGGEAEEVVQGFQGGCQRVLLRYMLQFLAVHPLLDAMRLGAGSMTVGKRMALQLAGVFGVLATNALIFNFSGQLRDWEADAECPIASTSQLFIIVATLVSILVNAVPNSFLAELGKQVHGRTGWNLAWWFLACIYLGLTIFLVVVALANLNPQDQYKWHRSLEWSLTIKMLGMPAAQALRHTVMLEIFLWQDRRMPASSCFLTGVGLRHPAEADADEPLEAVLSAKRSITVEGLLRFLQLLGNKIMPDFDMRTSSAQDVLEKGIRPCCEEPPPLDPIRIEVLDYRAHGEGQAKPLACCVAHLAGGEQRGRRACISECKSEALAPGADGAYRWAHFQAYVSGLQLEQAVAFFITQGGKPVAVAFLSAQELLEGPGTCEMVLVKPRPSQMQCWACDRRWEDWNGEVEEQGRLVIKATLPPDVRESLGRVERSLLRTLEVSPLQGRAAALRDDVLKGEEGSEASRPFCDTTEGAAGKVVVHGMAMVFSQLVAAVIADALSRKGAYVEIHAMLLQGRFEDATQALRAAGVSGERYWLSIFAASHLAPSLAFEALPTVLRALRRGACSEHVAEIKRGDAFDASCPISQLLLLDKAYSLLSEPATLAAMMLARTFRMQQHLALQPDHLEGGGLGEELNSFREQAAALQPPEYATAFLEDRQAVYDTFRDLAVAAVKEEREDSDATWQELSMANIYAAIAAVQASRASRAGAGDAEGLEDIGAAGDGDGGD